jgi:large subunit ribosomal protein L15
MKLETLKPNKGAKHRRKRLGKGESSGRGKTSGRGNKGQKSRTGGGNRPGFEGGQMPLARRLPKKGFNNDPFRKIVALVNVGDLDKVTGDVVDETSLRAAGLVKGAFAAIKILGTGTLKRKLQVEVHRVSRGALEKINSAGGNFVELATEASGATQASAS